MELSICRNVFKVFSLIYHHVASILLFHVHYDILYSIIYGTAFSCNLFYSQNYLDRFYTMCRSCVTLRFCSSFLSCPLFVHNSLTHSVSLSLLPVGEVRCDVQEGGCNGAEGFLLHYTAACCCIVGSGCQARPAL